MRKLKRHIILIVLPILLAFTQTDEYSVKLSYLMKFPKFITWPENENLSKENFKIAIWKSNPFEEIIEETIKGSSLLNMPVQYKVIETLEEIEGHHVLFIPRPEKEDIDKIIESCNQNHVLSVSERDGFAKKGTLINLIRVSGKIRFEINKTAVDNNGFKFNSQLYKLAIIVE